MLSASSSACEKALDKLYTILGRRSLNGLRRLNGAGELPRSMVPEELPVDAGGRVAGYNQLA